MTELKTKLLQADSEKDKLAKQVRQLFKDKDETQRHLQSLAVSHENKITEMHCIIAELSKKLNIQRDNQIAEESENDQNSGELELCRNLTKNFQLNLYGIPSQFQNSA